MLYRSGTSRATSAPPTSTPTVVIPTVTAATPVTPNPSASTSASPARFAVSIAPYTKLTLELADYAVQNGVPVVALTDSPVAPLAQIADHKILVPTGSPSFFHTLSPGFIVAEILGAIIAGRSGEDALAALTHVDALHATLGSHVQSLSAKRSS